MANPTFLEALEDRQLLAASFTVSGSLLTVTGSAGADAVAIIDNGTGAAGNITLRLDNGPLTPLTGNAIQTIRVNAEQEIATFTGVAQQQMAELVDGVLATLITIDDAPRSDRS